jgi:hypothetical protein
MRSNVGASGAGLDVEVPILPNEACTRRGGPIFNSTSKYIFMEKKQTQPLVILRASPLFLPRVVGA